MFHQGSTRSRRSKEGKTKEVLRQRRSISDIALHFVHNQGKEEFKNEDVRGLVRLCGKSMFYLPAEYATGSLVLPTCLRATAQYLVQHGHTSGIFRVPGSVRTINALYDYYCADSTGEDIATTTRCPNLPSHLNCGVHDIASTFKRLLAGLPGGILGSLSLFDALVAINSQLHGYAETSRTKESRLKARLIALAISTVRSQYQRELICSVFGLLCLVGRAAETAPREDFLGRPVPTADLMGYNALSIVFGPLLIGDLLKSYSMKLADPALGLIILPITPRKARKHRKASRTKKQKPNLLTVDRIYVANEITEMILIHWRGIVRHLKDLNAIKEQKGYGSTPRVSGHSRDETQEHELRKSMSDTFDLKGAPDWEAHDESFPSQRFNSPLAATPTPQPSECPCMYTFTTQALTTMAQGPQKLAVPAIVLITCSQLSADDLGQSPQHPCIGCHEATQWALCHQQLRKVQQMVTFKNVGMHQGNHR
ncbi:hypothetical protein BKA67DRAFT_521859 [Truncatella angustata]|uniref:Rho-GAP domain-containing protein n=1 Tax=Truncatella angustata TaxID=152316 RepID=A0A9P8UFL7_9PEZI|nr:uncharacterized protein BKA67DRAFT_521859 [Truncatella angustata]KAH6648985.1 hypothetical protein BKA67DRAFT_521859 [Truncatella angustata]